MPRRSPSRIPSRPCSKSSVTTPKRARRAAEADGRAQPGARSCALSGPWSAALGLGAREARRSGRRLGRVSTGAGGIRQSRQQVPVCRSIEGCSRKSKPRGETRKPPWPGSTERWRWRARPESIGSTPDCIASAAKSSSNKTPPTPPAAEAAFLAAIAVAQQQKARSFELRAALSLAKLYQSTGRPIDAHDVLGAGAGRLFADAGVSADRGGEGAVRGARGGRGGESRGRPPRATAEIADRLRPGRHVVARATPPRKRKPPSRALASLRRR